MRREAAWVLLLYTVLAILLTGPAWISAAPHIVGGEHTTDLAGSTWAPWWVGHAIGQGINPFGGAWNYVPIGQPHLSQYNLLDGFLGAPWVALFGPRLGYNLSVVTVLLGTAVGTHVLARTAGARPAGAVVAAVGLATSNFLLLEIGDGRPAQGLLLFWLLALAGGIRLVQGKGSARIAGLAGVCAAAACYTYWYYGLFLVLAALPFLVSHRRNLGAREWKLLGLMAGVAALLCLPAVWELAGAFKDLPGVDKPVEARFEYPGLDRGLFGMGNIISQSHWPIWPIASESYFDVEKQLSLGLLGLAAWGLWTRVPGWTAWGGVALTGWILTLGPYLRLGDNTPTSIPLPYLLLYDHLPFFSRFWWPQRLELLVVVGIAILAALATDQILASRPAKRWLLAAPFIVLLDSPWRTPHLPIPSHEPLSTEWELYEKLEGAVVTLPLMTMQGTSRHQLWMQTHHEQPILGGLGEQHAGHRPPGFEAFVRSNLLLDALWSLGNGSFQSTTLSPNSIEELRDLGFEWVVLDPLTFEPGLRYSWVRTFEVFLEKIWGPPDLTTGEVTAWKIKPLDAPVEIAVSFQSNQRPSRRSRR